MKHRFFDEIYSIALVCTNDSNVPDGSYGIRHGTVCCTVKMFNGFFFSPPDTLPTECFKTPAAQIVCHRLC